MNVKELENTLANVNRPTIVTVWAEVVPDMYVKDQETGERNPYLGRTVKQSRVNGMICWTYAVSVNNQRQREANPQTVEEAHAVPVFIPEPRKWGERVPNTPLVNHKGKVYLELKVERVLETCYLIDGQTADPEVLRPFLKTKQEGRRQEVAKPVVLRDYALENIKGIQFQGEYHRIAA